jgi:hypothetical protein
MPFDSARPGGGGLLGRFCQAQRTGPHVHLVGHPGCPDIPRLGECAYARPRFATPASELACVG